LYAVTEALLIDGVSFAYDTLAALENISLKVKEREFLGIVGPNAGGKSTLLKLILGILAPQKGRILVFNRSPKEARRQVGYVPQYPNFARDFPITVEQAVLMGRLGPGIRFSSGYSKTDRMAARRSLEEVEAADIATRQIGALSGGQLQRMLLARALASHPRLLILDEPTANIDQRVEGEIFDLLRTLNQRMTILVVSHDIAFISSYVSRVACLSRTLLCHDTDSIDGEVIHTLYGDHVRRVAHEACASCNMGAESNDRSRHRGHSS
jgi:zinc transport system ATP-binding protein